MDSLLLYPIIILIVIGFIFVVSAVIALSRTTGKRSRYQSKRTKYVQGEFSPQVELDLRLPYHRFKQLYPNSKLNYEQYKQLQKRRAFRRSMSNQDNHRMVR